MLNKILNEPLPSATISDLPTTICKIPKTHTLNDLAILIK